MILTRESYSILTSTMTRLGFLSLVSFTAIFKVTSPHLPAVDLENVFTVATASAQ